MALSAFQSVESITVLHFLAVVSHMLAILVLIGRISCSNIHFDSTASVDTGVVHQSYQKRSGAAKNNECPVKLLIISTTNKQLTSFTTNN